MEIHQVIVCNTDSKRVAVLDGNTGKSDWCEGCHAIADDWIKRNGKKEAAYRHIAHGNVYVWIH